LVPFRCFGTISADPATALVPDPGLLPGVEADPAPAAAVPITDRKRISPSFAIRGAAPAAGGPSSWTQLQPRLDRINSAELLRLARAAYFGWLSGGGGSGDPLGIVLTNADAGRVVFELPVLLPGEQFVPIAWLRPGGQGRGRTGRPVGGARPPG
jgi:hypothetical protein